jgi:hypothetical protein
MDSSDRIGAPHEWTPLVCVYVLAVLCPDRAPNNLQALRAGDLPLRSRWRRKLRSQAEHTSRWGLEGVGVLRYHGCHAVRHDDHVHVQAR